MFNCSQFQINFLDFQASLTTSCWRQQGWLILLPLLPCSGLTKSWALRCGKHLFLVTLPPKVYLDGVVTVVDSKNCLTQMKGGGDPNASGGLSDWLRQVKITAKTFDRGWIGRS